jgi:hypothetical protein
MIPTYEVPQIFRAAEFRPNIRTGAADLFETNQFPAFEKQKKSDRPKHSIETDARRTQSLVSSSTKRHTVSTGYGELNR